jgi:hypothetical protein
MTQTPYLTPAVFSAVPPVIWSAPRAVIEFVSAPPFDVPLPVVSPTTRIAPSQCRPARTLWLGNLQARTIAASLVL